jgi:hypothetical protein
LSDLFYGYISHEIVGCTGGTAYVLEAHFMHRIFQEAKMLLIMINSAPISFSLVNDGL